MITKLVLIFFAGFVVDLLITKYTSDVARERVWRATVLSGLITVANSAAHGDPEGQRHGRRLQHHGFCGGNSLGTFFAMRHA